MKNIIFSILLIYTFFSCKNTEENKTKVVYETTNAANLENVIEMFSKETDLPKENFTKVSDLASLYGNWLNLAAFQGRLNYETAETDILLSLNIVEKGKMEWTKLQDKTNKVGSWSFGNDKIGLTMNGVKNMYWAVLYKPEHGKDLLFLMAEDKSEVIKLSTDIEP